VSLLSRILSPWWLRDREPACHFGSPPTLTRQQSLHRLSFEASSLSARSFPSRASILRTCHQCVTVEECFTLAFAEHVHSEDLFHTRAPIAILNATFSPELSGVGELMRCELEIERSPRDRQLPFWWRAEQRVFGIVGHANRCKLIFNR
jgi:hypothetical protein